MPDINTEKVCYVILKAPERVNDFETAGFRI